MGIEKKTWWAGKKYVQVNCLCKDIRHLKMQTNGQSLLATREASQSPPV